MKVLIACEESQVVCKAFREKGHEAFSCDIQDCSGGHPEWHIIGDVLSVINEGWDLMIGHPPCTYLTYAGTAHWDKPGRLIKRLDALDFFDKMWLAPIDKICLENPRGCASPVIAKYSQEIHPWQFGHPQTKATWLWLKNLPLLDFYVADNLFEKKNTVEVQHTHFYKTGKKAGKPISWTDIFTPGEDRGKLRSKTFTGIAKAMAEQWG